MKKSFIVLVLATLAITSSAFAQAPNWSTFNGGQLIVTVKHAEPLNLGKGWQTVLKGAIFTMPTQNFSQLWGYFGVQKGGVSFYGGPAYNWQGGDHVFVGTTVDVTFGRFLWETELDNIFNSRQEQYLWTGVDVNYTVFGTHAFWFGPHVEATRTHKTCAQFGARVGLDRFQVGQYFGDRGWNTRVSFTIPVK